VEPQDPLDSKEREFALQAEYSRKNLSSNQIQTY
jgi:hypothetical protein